MVNTKPKRTATKGKGMKIIGYEQRINPATGEIHDVQVISREDRDFNFNKIWLGHIVQALDLIGNQKIKVLNYLLENKNYENVVIGTLDQIAKKANVGRNSVHDTLKILRENNIIVKVSSAVYRLNPDIIFKGGIKNRMNVLIQYQKEKETPEKIETEDLMEQLNRLLKAAGKIKDKLTKIGYFENFENKERKCNNENITPNN